MRCGNDWPPNFPTRFALHLECTLVIQKPYGPCSPSFLWQMLDYDSAKGETMRNLAGGLALLLLAASSTLVARAQTDDEAVRKLPQAFCDAWAKHDGHQLAIIMADDVDFVNVGANWLHGRSD